MLKLGLSQAVELAELAVQQHGAEYVYERVPDYEYGNSCVYWKKDGSPSCLVGHILDYAGMRPVREDENGWGIDQLVEIDRIMMDPITLTFLEALQAGNDSSGTWGDVLQDAKDKVARFQELQETAWIINEFIKEKSEDHVLASV